MPYVPTSDILVVGDALAAWVNAQWTDRGANAGAERLYQTPDATALKTLTGRKVWIFPAEYTDEPGTRGETLNTYRFGVIVAERYAAAGSAPKEWLDERVDWVANDLTDWLNFGGDSGHAFLQIGTREVLTAEVEPVQVYDPPVLVQKGLFWAELEYVFQEFKPI